MGVLFVFIFFSWVKPIPKVVREQQRLMSLMLMSNEEALQIEKSLDSDVVENLRVVFSTVDEMHAKRLHQLKLDLAEEENAVQQLAEMLSKSSTLKQVVEDKSSKRTPLKRTLTRTFTREQLDLGGAGEVPTELVD